MLVPGDGSQLVSLTHAADNAAMIAAAIGNSKAVGQIFNCGTTNFITCVAAHAAAATAAPSRFTVLARRAGTRTWPSCAAWPPGCPTWRWPPTTPRRAWRFPR